MAVSDQIIGAESGGDPNAANPNSSASGPGQFIDSTWLSVLRQHQPDIADGKSDADLLALKNDPALNRQMTDAYASDNQAILAKNSLPVTDGTTYLAHFAGPQGAVSVLKADPSASAASVLGPAATKANPFLANMTAGDLVAWANRKMGTSSSASPQPAAQPVQGVLSAGSKPATSAPGILNSGDDSSALQAFQGTLAKLLAQSEQPQSVPQFAPIQMAVPKGISRTRLLAALSQPVGG